MFSPIYAIVLVQLTSYDHNNHNNNNKHSQSNKKRPREIQTIIAFEHRVYNQGNVYFRLNCVVVRRFRMASGPKQKLLMIIKQNNFFSVNITAKIKGTTNNNTYIKKRTQAVPTIKCSRYGNTVDSNMHNNIGICTKKNEHDIS